MMGVRALLRGTHRIILMLFLISCLGAMWMPACGAAANRLEVANEYIRIVVNTNEVNMGRFSVGTTGGDPDRADDRDKPLIYGGDNPWTSYTTIRIGNQDWVFGGPTDRRAGRSGRYGSVIQPPTIEEGAIVTIWEVGPLEVTQRLSFVRSTTTGLKDTARIEYQLHNQDDVTHITGLRMMLDTKLGENDGAPFRIDDQAYMTDAVFYSDAMPEFWQAFDSLSEPQVMSEGTLSGYGVTEPDRVYLSNWGSLADREWNFDFQPGRDFTRIGEFELDSAIALFWDPEPLAPGQTRSFVTHYGLGGVTIAAGDLLVGVTSPAEATADEDVRQSFPVIAYIQNTGRGEALDVTANIRLPGGLELVHGTTRQELGNLDVNETIQTSWQVIPTGRVSGDLAYDVVVDAINSDQNLVSRSIRVVSPARLEPELSGPLALSVENERLAPMPVEITASVRNVGGSTAHRLHLALDHPVGLRLAPGDRRDKYPGSLGPGEEVTVRWHLEPTGESGEPPYSLSMRSSVGQEVRTNFIMIPRLQSRVWVGMPEAYGAKEPVPGDYVTVPIWVTNVKDFARLEMDLHYDPDQLELVAGPLDISRGTLFVDRDTAIRESFEWSLRHVDNDGGVIRGFVGDRGDAVLPYAFGTAAHVHFRVKSAGNVELQLQNVGLYDAHGAVRSFDVQNHSFTIED